MRAGADVEDAKCIVMQSVIGTIVVKIRSMRWLLLFIQFYFDSFGALRD